MTSREVRDWTPIASLATGPYRKLKPASIGIWPVACRAESPGTPTFYVNGIRHDGGYGLESLRSAILAHIDGHAKAHSRHA